MRSPPLTGREVAVGLCVTVVVAVVCTGVTAEVTVGDTVGDCVGAAVGSGLTSREEAHPDIPTKSSRHARTTTNFRTRDFSGNVISPIYIGDIVELNYLIFFRLYQYSHFCFHIKWMLPVLLHNKPLNSFAPDRNSDTNSSLFSKYPS